MTVKHGAIYQMLRQPIYAGAFVFGRSETGRELDPETKKVILRRVCIGGAPTHDEVMSFLKAHAGELTPAQ